jgi:nitrate reductase gamma subunit
MIDQIPASQDWTEIFANIFVVLVIAIILLGSFFEELRKRATLKRIADAEDKADKSSEATPAWNLARVTLESYFNRNLSQVTAIFWLSVIVMLAGFVIIGWGISRAIQSPNSTLVAVLTGSAGMVTELIGATFLFIYRSTMQQAINYTKILERINSVGMAMRILDSMPTNASESDLKNSTKAVIVKSLMQQSYQSEKSESPQNIGAKPEA